MRQFLINLYWRYLERQQQKLIPDAYFNDKKRIKLCRIDEKLIRLKEKELNGNKNNRI